MVVVYVNYCPSGSNLNCGFLVLIGSTSRSYSTVGICPRSRTVSPSIGSFHTLGTRTLESRDGLQRVLEDSKKEDSGKGEQRIGSPNQTSPKRKRQMQKIGAPESTGERGAKTGIRSDFDKGHAGSPNQLHDNASKEQIEMLAAEKDVIQVEEDPSEAEKKKGGASKKSPMEAVEEDVWLRKSVDDLHPESEDDVISSSDSGDDDSGKQRNVDGDADIEEAQDSPTPKKVQKRGHSKKDLKGKTPVQKRVIMSRVTRSGANKKPKAK